MLIAAFAAFKRKINFAFDFIYTFAIANRESERMRLPHRQDNDFSSIQLLISNKAAYNC